MNGTSQKEKLDSPLSEWAWISGAEARSIFRKGEYSGPTCGISLEYVQANMVVLPDHVADTFEDYCRSNPQACPLLERLPVGDPMTKTFAKDADIRYDLPRYRVYSSKDSFEEVTSIEGYFTDHDVAFLMGCSFSFEGVLEKEGIAPGYLNGRVRSYISSRLTKPVGPFGGPMVVSMRPVPREKVSLAYEVTRRLGKVHGEPVHYGDPRALGIEDLQSPDFGVPIELKENEIPVFWACGITSQMACFGALKKGDITRIISHAPGHMLIGDLKTTDIGFASPEGIGGVKLSGFHDENLSEVGMRQGF